MSTVNVNEIAQAIAMAMSSMQSANPMPQFTNQTQSATKRIPMGCKEELELGVYFADSVLGLLNWSNHVVATDGGTYNGLRVLFRGETPVQPKAGSKAFSKRAQSVCRLEISRPAGRNPFSEVVNIFTRSKGEYTPYLDAKGWAIELEEYTFKNVADEEDVRKVRIRNVLFYGEQVSDYVDRKLQHVASRLGGEYTCYDAAGKVVELEQQII